MSDGVAASGVVIDRRAQRPRLEIAAAAGPATSFSKTARLTLALIVVLSAVLRLWRLTAYGLFSDEVFSAETVHRTWPDMQRAMISDVVHPPLFYYLLKAWIVLSDSLLWMKLFPVLFSLLVILPFVLMGRELKLRATAINLALFLMAVNEYLINYAQDLRMYSLLLLLVTTSMWLFARLINTDKRASGLPLMLLATNLLLVYTHYYGWLIVGSELMFLLVRRRDRLLGFALSVGLLVAGFFPWAFAVTEAAYDKGGLGPNLKWNTRPAATDFFQHYVTLNGPVYTSWRAYATILSTVIFFTPILLWLWRWLTKAGPVERGHGIDLQARATTESRPHVNSPVAEADEISRAEGHVFLWLALLAFLPALVAFTASYVLKQSVWGSRFLIIVAPAYLWLVAIAATKLQLRKWRYLTVALIAGWAALSGILQLTHRDKISWQPLVEQMIQQEMSRSESLPVYTRQGVTGTTIQYYLNQANQQRLHIAYLDDYAEIDEAHFWIAFIRYRHDTGPLPFEALAARGDRLGDAIEADAPGHKVIFIPVWRHQGNPRSSPGQ